MSVINQAKLDLFLQQAVIRSNYDALKFQIHQHFNAGGDYVLFRHSSLYFFRDGIVSSVQATRDQYQYRDYLRFDGERVSKIDPEYYLGALASRHTQSGENLFDDDNSNDSDSDSSGDNSNNNNNNNNNNGNNGNNG